MFWRMGAYGEVSDRGSLLLMKTAEEGDKKFRFPFLGEQHQTVPSRWGVSTRIVVSAWGVHRGPQWIKDAPPNV